MPHCPLAVGCLPSFCPPACMSCCGDTHVHAGTTGPASPLTRMCGRTAAATTTMPRRLEVWCWALVRSPGAFRSLWAARNQTAMCPQSSSREPSCPPPSRSSTSHVTSTHAASKARVALVELVRCLQRVRYIPSVSIPDSTPTCLRAMPVCLFEARPRSGPSR